MKFPVRVLPVLLASLCIPAAAAQGAWLQLSEQRRNELRDAVEAHRATQREEVRREETAAGRRLTAAELAELREQVRRQWMSRAEAVQSAASTDARRDGPIEGPRGQPVAAPRISRP